MNCDSADIYATCVWMVDARRNCSLLAKFGLDEAALELKVKFRQQAKIFPNLIAISLARNFYKLLKIRGGYHCRCCAVALLRKVAVKCSSAARRCGSWCPSTLSKKAL